MKYIIAISLLLFAGSVQAADHYASPTGSDTWANSTSVSTPCSITTAFSSAVAGDTVYLRGGTYAMGSSSLTTTNAGSIGNQIVIENYSGETPSLTFSGVNEAIAVEDPYWTFKGLTITAVTSNADAGLFRVGENSDANHVRIENCNLTVSSTNSHDNVAAVSLQADRANYAYIYNNIIVATQGTNYTYGIIYLGGGNIGTQVLRNEISGGQHGIYVKHRNLDASLGDAEIKYNYIHGCINGVYGNPQYIEIEHNISNHILLGDNGGLTQGHNNLINHNTIIESGGIELWSPSEGPITDCTITNNIFPTKTTYGSTESLNTWNYNMYGDDAAIGANDVGTSSPSFVDGLTPSSVAGYALTAESPGYQDGSGGTDIGVDVSLVGAMRGRRYAVRINNGD